MIHFLNKAEKQRHRPRMFWSGTKQNTSTSSTGIYKEGALRSFPLTSPFNFDIETYTDGNSFEWGICSGNKEEARVKFTSE